MTTEDHGPRRQALRPLETLTNVLTVGLALGVVLVALIPVWIIAGDIASPTCATARGAVAGDLLGDAALVARGVPAGAQVSVEGLEICTPSRPGVSSALWTIGPALPGLALAIGLVALLHTLLRRATRHGLFSVEVARTVRLTGWVVIVGSCLVALVTAGVATALLEHVAPGSAGPGSVITNLDIPGSALVAGVAILTTARILRLAVELRQDVDATI